ncbi:arginine N-succinyltransferase [Pseudaeromonas paramecii]|uniref:Arginine/ornithine succinyltransferase subunit alpha n=1 Tax=Pseudaeromonas paramecii TaxID=2138166 RepID=A0ABP8QLK4_9GAMM
MKVLRPAVMADLPQIERMAQQSGPMVCTLPVSRAHLQAKISRSQAALAAEVLLPGEESYFFVLEDLASGRLQGTCAILAQAGFGEPFHAYRNEVVIHASRALGVHQRLHSLCLSHELSDHSQLCSFYLEPELRQGHWPRLLTQGRLLFIAQHPERFAPDLVAVLPGRVDEAGRSPFWEQVGRRFFGIDYHQAEFYHGTQDRRFIAELMPHHPLYVSLLAEEAQAALGQVHPDARLQFDLLEADGFEADDFVEIFDAGPVVQARRTTLHSWQTSQLARVADISPSRQSNAPTCLLVNQALAEFRALLTPLSAAPGQALSLAPEVAEALRLRPGDPVRWLALESQ